MNREQPDLLRQSDGFERIHVNLTVSLISTSRHGNDEHGPRVRVCRVDDTFGEVKAANLEPIYDYLPVEGADRHIVGLFSAKRSADGTDVEDEFVKDHMCPLSEEDLIGADATILDFIRRVRPQPLLVVSGGRIDGLVAWSDLQKLPVRATIFALVTGFELTMYEAIKAIFPEGDGWRKHLSDKRLDSAEEVYEKRHGNESDVELLLCTEFCDKRTILKKCLTFDSQAKSSGAMRMSKGEFEDQVKRIENLRNPLAHASSYAMKWDDVIELRETVTILLALRKHIKTVLE